MNRLETINPGISVPIRRAEDLQKMPIIVALHSEVPLFYLRISQRGSRFLGISEFRFSILSFDKEDEIIFYSCTEQRLKEILETGNRGISFILEGMLTIRAMRGALAKSKMDPAFLRLRGYMTDKQLLKDISIFFDKIPNFSLYKGS